MGVGEQHLDLLILQGSRPWAPAMTMKGRVYDCQLPPCPAPQGKFHRGFKAVSLTHQRMLLGNQVMGWTRWGTLGLEFGGDSAASLFRKSTQPFLNTPMLVKEAPPPPLLGPSLTAPSRKS